MKAKHSKKSETLKITIKNTKNVTKRGINDQRK